MKDSFGFDINPSYLSYRAPQPQQQTAVATAPKKKNSGMKGWLSSLIGEAGGTGGAIGGASLGASLGSVVPGIGTVLGGLAGAGIGGFLGGTGGQLAENKVRDNSFDVGKAVKEGAVSGVLGAGPLRLAKGGLAAGKALATGAEVAPTVEKSVTSSLLGKFPGTKGATQSASRLESRAGGFGIGQTLPGETPLAPKDVQNIRGILRKNSIKTGHPDSMVIQIEDRLNSANKDIQGALAGANRNLTKDEVSSIIDSFTNVIKGDATTDPAVRKSATVFANNLQKNLKTVEDVVIQRRNFQNNLINWGRNPASAIPGKEESARAVRTALNDFISNPNVAPELAKSNKNWSELAKASDYVTREAGRLTSASQNASGGGALAMILKGDTAQSVKGKTGRAGLNLLQERPAVPSTKGILGRIGGVSAINAATTPQQPEDVQGASTDTLATTTTNPGASISDTTDLSGGVLGANAPTSTGDPFGAASIQKAVMDDLANNKGKNVNTLLALYKTFGQPNEPQPLTAAQSNKLSGFKQAENTVNQLGGLFDKVNQPQNSVVAATLGLPGISNVRKTYQPNAREYTAFAEGTVIPIVRTLGESGALSNQDVARAVNLIPNLGDTPELAQKKLGNLKQLLAGARQSVSTTPGSGSDATDLLNQLQGAQ